MNTTQTTALITSTLTDFGGAVLVIITAVIGIGLAYLVFRFGWNKTKNSLNAGIPEQFTAGNDLGTPWGRK